MATPSQEDYLEAIWRLTAEKGYARVSDIALLLGVSRASVSKMTRRLHDLGLLAVERYRGLTLTPQGRSQGLRLLHRHQILERFLGLLGVADAGLVWHDVEGIEHHVGPESLARIAALVEYAENHPDWWAAFRSQGQDPSPL